jgi:hypothetical protein
MKTRNLFPTLLALALGIMVSHQTQAQKHRTLPTIGDVPKELKISGSTAVKTKVMPTLVSSSGEGDVKEAATQTQAAVVDNNTFNYFNNSNCYNTIVYAEQLVKEAENLGMVEKTLRAEASIKEGVEKTMLTQSANELLKQAELKLIQASEISGKLNEEKFKQNQVVYQKMSEFTHAPDGILETANTIADDAKHDIKMAKEMRQEAYAMHSNPAKLGTMNNAEEKESSALAKQGQAINMIQQYAANIKSNLSNMMVMK